MIQYTPHTTPREPGNTHAAEECAEHVTSRGWGRGGGEPISPLQHGSGGATHAPLFSLLFMSSLGTKKGSTLKVSN